MSFGKHYVIYLVSLSTKAENFEVDAVLDTDFKIVGTNVDIEVLVDVELTTADGSSCEGTAGGNT